MNNHEQVERFRNWTQQVARQPVLGNEGEIETKFVLPLFAHLGYPEACRRDKFYAAALPDEAADAASPVTSTAGKAYPDFVYFSTDNRAEQNAETALVIVEVKRAGAKIEKHLDQARLYGTRLRSLFIIITNGARVLVLRRRAGGGEEKIEDFVVTDFTGADTCLRFYEWLNFETACRVKALTADDLRYEQLLQLDLIINADPEIQEALRRGDFKPRRAENELGLIITGKKVSVSCSLPSGQDEGGCWIEFSNPLRRNLAVHVPFRQFRRTMLENLHAPPQQDTRKFLRRRGADMFEATLGSVTTVLSAAEASELCELLDEVGDHYKARVIEEETLHGTWRYERTRVRGELAYRLLTVSRPLWDLMKSFADEHDYSRGKSEWHNFSWSGAAIRVGRGAIDHVFLYATSDENPRTHLPNGYVHVLYNIPAWLYRMYDDFSYFDRGRWKQAIGPSGIWRADYTERWLRREFIPRVLEHYRRDSRVKTRTAFVCQECSESDWRPVLEDVQEVTELASYVQDVQVWLSGPARNIAAPPLRGYYASLTDIIRNASLPADQYGYVFGNLSGVSPPDQADGNRAGGGYAVAAEEMSGDAHEKVVQFLSGQVQRISTTEVENSSNAELLSRVFLCFLKSAAVRHTQQQLNAAKAAVNALWEQSQFEARYINSEV